MATLTTGKLSELFEDFLKTTTGKSGDYEYRSRISELIATEGKSITVDFEDLLKYNNDLANRVLLDPDSSLDAFRRAAYETMRSENAVYADRIRKVLTVRVRNIPDRIPLRKVDTSFLDKMIAVAGMVVRTSELRPLLVEGAFVCPSGHVTVQVQGEAVLRKPIKCETCEESRNLELDKRLSRFVDFQILRVQELPEELPPGQLPQFFDVNVEGDITNTARPGDRVVLTGIVRAVPDYSPGQGRMRLFKSQIDCSHIEVTGKEPEHLQITKEDEALIKSIAASPGAYDKLINSIAPVIIGHLAEKEAILLLLTGGTAKALPDGTKLRGDINILLVGDPGVAKSEMLKFASQVAPRGLFASGRGTTAAGLSAAVIRERNVLMLEAGVVVLADQGLACLHPESRVLVNGRTVKVGDLVHEAQFTPIQAKNGLNEVATTGGVVVSFDENSLRVRPGEATLLRRRLYSGRILTIRLRSGFVTKVTPDHLLLDGNSLEWREASSYKKGDLLTAPLRVPAFSEEDVFLWDILPDECTVSLTAVDKALLRRLLETKYGNLKTAAGALGINRIPDYYRQRLQPNLRELKKIVRDLGVEEGWRRRVHVYDKSPIRVPKLTPELAYICGFIFGDGSVRISRRRSSIVITQSPRHPEYIRQFGRNWRLTFGSLRLRRPRRNVGRIGGRRVASARIDWSVSRRILGHIYTLVTRENLSSLLTLPDEILKGFLAGITDSDGCNTKKVCKKNDVEYETWNIVYKASQDETTNLNLLLSLRRFGAVGSFRGIRKGVGTIVLSNRVDCNNLQSALCRYSVKMRKVPPLRLRNISGISEKLPKRLVSRNFGQIFNGMSRAELIKRGLWSTIYTRERRQPSSGQVLKIVERIPSLREVQRSELAGIAQKDYFLDEIIDIAHEDYTGYAYDLMMKENHNYVADGIFSHNCIDEFDKMRPEDRSALHEQMEQQSVTVAKGGIYATLNARTAILAATNPLLGKYNPYQNLTDNISLPIPLLSRFDLIFVIKDTPTPAEDEKLASHILGVHRKMGYNVPPPIEFKLLKKYLSYAKNITPILTKEAEERIKDYYLDLRRRGGEGTIGATPRTLESLIRLATARAKVLLRDQVREEDALAAVALMNKMVEDVLTDTATKTKADFGVLLGRPAGERSKLTTALEVFKGLEGPEKKPVERKLFKDELVKSGRLTDEDAEKMIRTMFKEGVIYESKPGFFRRVGS